MHPPNIGSRVAEREGSSGKYDWKGNFRLGWTNSSHGSLKLWIVSPCDHKLTASPSTWFDAATIWRQSISSYTLNSKSAKLCQAATQCNQSGGCAFAVVVIKPLSVSDDWYDEHETSVSMRHLYSAHQCSLSITGNFGLYVWIRLQDLGCIFAFYGSMARENYLQNLYDFALCVFFIPRSTPSRVFLPAVKEKKGSV